MVIKCYNTATGNCEIVSCRLEAEEALMKLSDFSAADRNTDHVYYISRGE